MNFGDRDRVMAPDTTFSYAHTALRKAAEAERALEAPAEPAADGLTLDTSDVFDEQARIWIAEGETADRLSDADRDAAERVRDAETRASELLSNARQRADTLLAEAEAFARQRRAEAERWSRTHVAEADQVGTQTNPRRGVAGSRDRRASPSRRDPAAIRTAARGAP